MGPIERALFLFLLVYLVISLASIIIHWYISMEMFKGLFKYQFNFKSIKRVNWVIISVFAIMPFAFNLIKKEDTITVISDLWLSYRLFLEFFLVGMMVLLAKIAQKKGLV